MITILMYNHNKQEKTTPRKNMEHVEDHHHGDHYWRGVEKESLVVLGYCGWCRFSSTIDDGDGKPGEMVVVYGRRLALELLLMGDGGLKVENKAEANGVGFGFSLESKERRGGVGGRFGYGWVGL
ncbi:hypothetical protein DKX38_027043 [Salix brachista]|uniref:Uncharacterized protein n=1 Tax=Salix brachista TaxID=2182728 RepID=A0A5N5JGA9_9ROSI|nr:hypothetical protein DKX38_027043 [Salix brachista]